MSLIKKLTVAAAGLAAIVTLAGCSAGISGSKINPPGIYEGKPQEGFSGPTYKFDSTASDTLGWVGSNPGLEFTDLNTGKKVRIYEKSNLKYHFTCIQTNKPSYNK
jgi:hypothetical protein